jgi:hypothetical protein
MASRPLCFITSQPEMISVRSCVCGLSQATTSSLTCESRRHHTSVFALSPSMCDSVCDIFSAPVMLRLERTEANQLVLQFNRAASLFTRLVSSGPGNPILGGGELSTLFVEAPTRSAQTRQEIAHAVRLVACWQGLGQPTAKIDICVVLISSLYTRP